MTLHISDIPEYHCHACDKVYIPYTEDFPCPYCAVPSKEFFDLIPQIVDSLIVHKMNYGRFTPDARYTWSLAEHLQSHFFHVMDSLEHYKQENPKLWDREHLESILDMLTSKRDPKESQYVRNVILASYKLYKAKNIVLSEEDLETPSFIRKKMNEKIIDIDNKKIGIMIWDFKEDMSSENIYVVIHLEDKSKDDITEYTLLHIWFSKLYLDTEIYNIDFNKIIDEEVNSLVNEVWDNLFKNEEYFVLYTSKWKELNKKFPPFIKK